MENKNLTVEEFEEAIEKANTVEEVIALYKSQGIDVTEDELKEIAGPDFASITHAELSFVSDASFIASDIVSDSDYQ